MAFLTLAAKLSISAAKLGWWESASQLYCLDERSTKECPSLPSGLIEAGDGGSKGFKSFENPETTTWPHFFPLDMLFASGSFDFLPECASHIIYNIP